MNAQHPNAAKDAQRRDRGQLETAIRDANGTVRGSVVKCPFHDDRNPSGSIFADEDGVWRFKCHTCGFKAMDVFDVRERSTGQPVADQLRELAPGMYVTPKKPARVFATVEELTASMGHYVAVERVHAYTNPDTRAVDMLVVRAVKPTGKKTFEQFQPNPGGGFISGAPPKPWPLYNRTVLRSATAVVVVEGEKCVEALRGIGVQATTSPGGAKNARQADWSPLAGLTVYLWPDNDGSGVDYMRDVAEMLAELRPMPNVFILDPATLGLPEKGDVVDYLNRLAPDVDKADAVWEFVAAQGQQTGAACDVFTRVEDMISGKWSAIDWKFLTLGRLSKALFPGTATLLCGDPGSTKSLLLLEALTAWHDKGVSVACYMLEDTRVFHLLRALAQMSGESGMTDDVWVREHPEQARAICARFAEKLNTFGACITSPGDRHPTTDELAAWVEEQCRKGVQIIAIDPITCADFSDKPWKDDRAFIWRCQRAIAFSGARLILVTHPRKGAGGGKSIGAMDDMAGGAAYPRHAQTVLWVQRKDPAEPVEIVSGRDDQMNRTEEVDRIVKIVKARNGKGHGCAIAFNFLTDSLTFEEVGLINGKSKPAKANPVATEWKTAACQAAPNAPRPQVQQDLGLDDIP